MAYAEDEEQIDLNKLRYVLYARKSTEDEDRQLRSIPDQIKECEQMAARLGLHIVGKPLTETKSAKRSGQRPIFKKMLEDIGAGKYDAILSWAPDRLCRNMLEGGRVIDMLDEGKIKDLRFPTFNFTNDANGKLTLGILFSISKHFTDELSRKVSRGIKGNFSEGKSAGAPKWGYDRDPVTGYYEPNQHFDVVQEAWRKRVNGESLEDIVAYLIGAGYHRTTKVKTKKTQKKILPSKQTLSKMFQDPFYYGLLQQAGKDIDLRLAYNFTPMIAEEDYNAVQAIGYNRTKDVNRKKRVEFKPLYRFVYCAICNDSKHMVVGKNRTGNGRYVLTYRCDNPACTRKPKSMRAYKIFDSIYAMLDKFELSDEAYERYSRRIESYTDAKLADIKQQLHSKRGALVYVDKELEERALKIVGFEKGTTVYETNERRINDLAIEKADLQHEIAQLEEKLANPQRIKLTEEEFLNTLKTAADKMRAGSAAEKDVLCRILFLNLRVDNEKVASYLWREPFASMVKATEIKPGRGDRT